MSNIIHIKTNKTKILVLSDIHAPWVNWTAIRKAKKWADKHNPDLVICLGDLTDQKIWSRWQSDTDDVSPCKEFDEAEKAIDKLYELFPKMYIIRGNHDNRVQLRAIEAGIPGKMFRDIDEVFNKSGWKWIPTGDRLIVETQRGPIMFIHGDEMAGTPAQKSRILGMSIVQGHTHKVSVIYTKTDMGHFFGAEMGCLMDTESKASRYAQKNPVGVSVGFGVIKWGLPTFIPDDFKSRV